MTISEKHIRDTLANYLAAYPEEQAEMAPVLALLALGANVTSRKEYRGHVTAGAVLTNPAGNILFVHHLALDKWLLPGGHLEEQDVTLLGAALRELAEETGILPELVVPLSEDPVHVDVHAIPASAAKGESAHQHVDFRFVFTTASDVAQLQETEVADAAWRGAHTLSDDRLRTRVAAASARA